MTPYDWQENMGHRAQFVEGRLAGGIPVAVASVPEGIVMATFRSQAGKLYELYDRLAFAAIGIQSDVEAVRVAAVEFCHQEGFRRSEEDVTVQRVAMKISEPVKRTFADFRMAPAVVRCLFAEVNETPEQDLFYVLDYDGDYSVSRGGCCVTGSGEAKAAMSAAMAGVDFSSAATVDALAQLREAVVKGMDPDGSKAAAGEIPELVFESAILRRDGKWARRFAHIEGRTI